MNPVADDLDRVTFSGRVTDLMGHVVIDVRVSARRIESEAEYVVGSNGQGEYRLINLPPGLYVLRADAPGFRAVVSAPLSGSGGELVRLDFTLGPAQVVEAMQIVARDSAIRVDPTRTVVGTTIGSNEIEQLPVESRNPLDLVFTLSTTMPPGLSDRDLAEGDRQLSYRRTPVENGIFSLAGGTPYSNNVTIEGLDNNDDREGRERFVPVPAGTVEIQVVNNQFAAE
ncbi:MAG: carboxypeptidase regulatory-like domain-containing protein, partial [Acidobacteria bacterium]|nr:carboxypeptidase regulatory-like domain-containing protein [Acidobacteriota bacterium]